MDLNECPPRPSGEEPASPSPVLRDENVSIYAIPILPSPLPPRSRSCSDSSSRKRRRSPTPDAPSKRIVEELEDGAPHSRRPSTSLTDEDADRIRRKVVSEMFRPAGVSYPSGSGVNQYNDVDVDVADGPPSAAPSQPFGSGRLPAATHAPHVVAYVAVGAPTRGRFDVDKTKALGVPKGPLWGRLGKGESVVTPDGRTVTPEMCLGPPKPPTVCEFHLLRNERRLCEEADVPPSTGSRYRPSSMCTAPTLRTSTASSPLETSSLRGTARK